MKFLLCVVLFCGSFAFAAPNPSPSGYDINIHVIESKTRVVYDGIRTYALQQVVVVIGGNKYQLRCYHDGLFALGDYKAKVRDQTKNGYDIDRTYTLLLPDGKTRDFYLSAILQ
jgi:hypothetical protein